MRTYTLKNSAICPKCGATCCDHLIQADYSHGTRTANKSIHPVSHPPTAQANEAGQEPKEPAPDAEKH